MENVTKFVKNRKYLPILILLFFSSIYIHGPKFDLPIVVILLINFAGLGGIEGFFEFAIQNLCFIYLLIVNFIPLTKKLAYSNILSTSLLVLYTLFNLKEITLAFNFYRIIIFLLFYICSFFFIYYSLNFIKSKKESN